jgi:RNA polymerase sigma factor (sigma-70 family)
MGEATTIASFPVDAGIGATFEEFFERHRRRLFSALWLVTRDRHEAEEIEQETFLRVWERWDHVRRLDDPDGYLYRASMNVYRNRRRRAMLALRRVVHAAPAADPIEAVDDRDAVVRALGRLTARQRAALVATHLLDLSSEEAAKCLGIRPATVRVLAARGRAALRDQMGAPNE